MNNTGEYETEECPTCGGNGFSGYGTGYDAVCDDCAGSGEVIVSVSRQKEREEHANT